MVDKASHKFDEHAPPEAKQVLSQTQYQVQKARLRKKAVKQAEAKDNKADDVDAHKSDSCSDSD
ncbi:hypothetical protein COLO4_05013 [Corchorus olitorius]|uniref:Uncharacterized protein n=1 Tax=Corchorus olitorius TaxID=93759 RepID=A0A1R3KS72_9ROSI|nr:hypothetical protein COLO4_05013 [Corchorus olitorius]